MYILLIIMYVSLGLVAILLIAALFAPKAYAIEREIVIDKSADDVFSYVRLLKNQVYYNKWTMTDPHVTLTYTGVDGTEDATATWDSQDKNVGKGEQKITKVVDGQRVELALKFIKPMPGEANAYIAVETISAGKSKVKWGLNSGMKYPMNIMLVLLNIPDMLGKDLTTGLQNLKNVLEK